jgi:hypothetical protein
VNVISTTGILQHAVVCRVTTKDKEGIRRSEPLTAKESGLVSGKHR